MKEEILTKTDMKIKKRIEQEETRLKGAQKDLTQSKSKSMMLVAVLMIGVMTMLNKQFSGVVVAKLPFEPIAFFKSLSHRNIEGDDLSDCSFIFLYILSTMSLRTSIQKLLGFTTSRAVDSLNQQTWQKQVDSYDKGK